MCDWFTYEYNECMYPVRICKIGCLCRHTIFCFVWIYDSTRFVILGLFWMVKLCIEFHFMMCFQFTHGSFVLFPSHIGNPCITINKLWCIHFKYMYVSYAAKILFRLMSMKQKCSINSSGLFLDKFYLMIWIAFIP